MKFKYRHLIVVLPLDGAVMSINFHLRNRQSILGVYWLCTLDQKKCVFLLSLLHRGMSER